MVSLLGVVAGSDAAVRAMLKMRDGTAVVASENLHHLKAFGVNEHAPLTKTGKNRQLVFTYLPAVPVRTYAKSRSPRREPVTAELNPECLHRRAGPGLQLPREELVRKL
ncbi:MULTISPECIES: hypothetical protein [unclassified Bradyrhizobium]|uniref:hypothetical protein n=1 Tax=unclassified Bradyrhizobium TaxID=2631580 RepID=UPI0028E75AA9|nr:MULTISPECIES: hypothetical protein [unclassified Bradyrhizobium]